METCDTVSTFAMTRPDDALVTRSGVEANTPAAEPLPPDAALRREMAAYQQGSLDAFQAVYGSLAPALGRYLRYLTRRADLADDLLQEVFLQMHRSRATYDPALPVAPWAFGLARNVYLMHRRSSVRFSAVHVELDDPPEVAVPPDVERFATRDLIRRAVARLDPEQAEPLVLHHVWGFSFEEIAGMVGISPAAARARSSRAMAALRGDLTHEEGPRK